MVYLYFLLSYYYFVVLFSFPRSYLRMVTLLLFSPLWCKYFLSLSSLYNKNNNNHKNTNSNNNNHNNNNNNNIIPYTTVNSYSSLYTFTLNVIINTYLFKKKYKSGHNSRTINHF